MTQIPKPIVKDPSSRGALILPRPAMRRLADFPEGSLELVARQRSRQSPDIKEDTQVPLEDSSITDGARSVAATNLMVVELPTTPAVTGGSPSAVGEVWHYTNTAGLVGIIETNAIHATSLSSLNDSAEYKHGRAILDDLLGEVKRSRFISRAHKRQLEDLVVLSDDMAQSPGLYVLSASVAQHSLAQWRSYGGGQGHALALDPSMPLAILGQTPESQPTDATEQRWRRVIYDFDDQRELLLAVLGYLLFYVEKPSFRADKGEEEYRSLAVVVTETLAYCKDSSFAEEQEVRIVAGPPPLGAIEFRTGATGVTPYLRLTAATQALDRVVTHPGRLPVTRVIVGPFPGREESGVATRILLQARGYDTGMPVVVSPSTLR